MKKITFICIVIFVCMLVGCDYKRNIENAPSHIAQNQAKIILDCLKTGKTEELKKLFCNQIKSSHDLDKEIAKAINFVKGDIIDDGTWIGMSEGGKSIDNGTTIKLDIHPAIINLKTSDGNNYSIFLIHI